MDENEILEKAHNMISEGADILDVGAMSSRPGAELLPAEVELDRMVMACVYPSFQISKRAPFNRYIPVKCFRSFVAL